MITVITGLTGSGKTFLMTRLLYKEFKNNQKLFLNFPVFFGDDEKIQRWHQLDELYRLNNGVIGIDEGQKLFDARRWASLPVSFAEKIAQHRKHNLDIYTTTQDLGHIDVRVRQNIHELFHCQSLFRFPKSDSQKPIFQVIRIIKKVRIIKADNDRISWIKTGSMRFMFLSRYWTKSLYNTYNDIGFERYICKVKTEGKKWRAKIYARDLVNQGKARI